MMDLWFYNRKYEQEKYFDLSLVQRNILGLDRVRVRVIYVR